MNYTEYRDLWMRLYDGVSDEEIWESSCRLTWEEIEKTRGALVPAPENSGRSWYENLVVYALYPQHFNRSISGITEKIDHFEKLGVNCLWLLPILDSPMRDEGFDISDYRKIRGSLFSGDFNDEKRDQVFSELVHEASKRNISIIFDIALNHVSSDHHWFQSATEDKKSKYRDYFIWSDSPQKYSEARIIFKGLLDSNWSWNDRSAEYYFHRFYPHQPDLNYRNPEVLGEIIDTLLYWIRRGIRGFRVDAAPYLWKEEGSTSENLAQTHEILKIIRASVDLVGKDILLLAEACQPPKEVVAYFGDSDECQGAYHFPLMPRMYKAILEENPTAISSVLSPGITPDIPVGSQWFTFLRCHDELTLEMVSPEERRFLHSRLCRRPEWDFRQGEGISARIAELFEEPRDVLFAHLLLLGLRGNPVLYYGDEFLVGNNKDFAQKQLQYTGYSDSRNLVRGPLDWDALPSLGENCHSDPALKDVPRWHACMLAEAVRRRRNAEIFGLSHREEIIATEDLSLLEIVKKGDSGSLPDFSLFYNFSATEPANVDLKERTGKIYLYWSGETGKGYERMDEALSKTDGRISLPAKAVLWIKRA